MLRLSTKTFAAIAATSLILLPAFSWAQGESVAASPSLPAIVVTKAVVKPLVERVVATGTIQPVSEIFVQPLVEGLSIKSVNVDVGDRVAAGEVVAELNEDSLILQRSQLEANLAKAEAALAQYQAQLNDAKINAAEAKRQYARSVELGKSGTLPTSQIEQSESASSSAAAKVTTAEKAIAIAEADIKVVESQKKDVELNLARTEVKSPVAGVIASKNANVGSIASGAGQPLFTVYRDGEVELVADVSETQILKVKEGQKVMITLAGGTEQVPGRVRLVSPVVDPVTRLGAVHVKILDNDRARAGMYASAEIIVTEADDIALPLSAVTMGRTSTTTRIVKDGVVHQVDITTGIEDSGFIQVTGGLQAGDMIVAKAGAFVRDGDKINPVREDAVVSN
ncbi:efflux RND transporter periplasmic adaptor subunit [Agrobacterium sp. ES01]|uniref:efflux RND transporter periplasmic adaptor subunit n=1 Tax=Agrobacterium sp. ES01 TaxID=3420714 RepID=UPI003D0B2DED